MKDPDKTENRMTLTIKETASLLGISLPTCYALANREDFPALRFGRKILVNRDGLTRWLEKQTGGLEKGEI